MVWKFISLYYLQASGSGIEVERVDSGVGSEIKLDATIENKVRENFASSECDIIQIVKKSLFLKGVWNSIPK